jgi:hypothetical protein
VCKNPLCVCYRLTSKAQRRECQSQPRVQRRQHLELDAKCAPPINMSPSPAIIICGKRRQLNESVDTLHYCVMCAYHCHNHRFWMQTLKNAALPPSPSMTQWSIASVDERKYVKYYWCSVLWQALVVGSHSSRKLTILTTHKAPIVSIIAKSQWFCGGWIAVVVVWHRSLPSFTTFQKYSFLFPIVPFSTCTVVQEYLHCIRVIVPYQLCLVRRYFSPSRNNLVLYKA